MATLISIPGIGKTSLELLEAAGFLDAESLAKAGVDELTEELVRANRILGIAKRAPARGNVLKWIQAARKSLDLPELEDAPTKPGTPAAEKPAPTMPVNYEGNPQVLEMLSAAPFAIPFPARQLVENKIAVSDIPPAILLNRYSGDLEVRIQDRSPSTPKPQRQNAPGYVQVSDSSPARLEIDVSRLRSTEDMQSVPRKLASSKSTQQQEDRVALIRAPRESTNRGLDPSSRRYVRGVLHTHPFSIRLGAIITLIQMALLPLSIISAILLLLSDQKPETFSWVPKGLLAFPLALPVFGIAWLIWGLTGSCRICGQKLFMPRACRKNAKAHHIPFIGYIVPLCFHLLLFSWFRCTFCGTPVRLKK